MMRRDGFAVLGICICALLWFTGIELMFPRYFLWDDNAAFFLPSILFGEELLRTEYTIPIINFFQFAGWNHLGAAHTGVLYPPNYLAAWIAGTLLQSPLWTIDIIAILHLVGGMLGMYMWLRLLKVAPRYATGGALLYLTLPFSMILARSWMYVVYAHCFIAACFAFLEWNLQHLSPVRKSIYILTKTLFVYCGYIQYVVYLSIFEILYCTLRHKISERIMRMGEMCLLYMSMNIAVCMLSLPLLLPMAEVTLLSATRSSPLPILEALSGSIEPIQTLLAQLYVFYGSHAFVESGQMVFLGGSIVFFLWGTFLAHPLPRPIRTITLLLFAALALSTPLHILLSLVPVINRFRWPFKIFLLAGFFYVTAFTQALSHTSKSGKIKHCTLLALCFFALLSQMLMVSTPPYSSYSLQGVGSPFPERWGNFRTVSTGPLSMKSLPEYLETMPAYNVPTLWKLPVLGGYDHLASRTHRAISISSHNSGMLDWDTLPARMVHLSQWSVRYLVSGGPLPDEIINKTGVKKITAVGTAIVYENPGAYPIAAFTQSPRSTLDIEYHANRLRIATYGQTGTILLRVAPIAGYQLVHAHSKQKPIHISASGILLTVDNPEEFVDAVYHSKTYEWGWMGSTAGVIIFVGYFILQTFRKSSSRKRG